MTAVTIVLGYDSLINQTMGVAIRILYIDKSWVSDDYIKAKIDKYLTYDQSKIYFKNCLPHHSCTGFPWPQTSMDPLLCLTIYERIHV